MTDNDQIFNLELLNRANQEPTIWQRIRMCFRPINYSNDGPVTIWFQKIDGITFVRRIIIKKENP